MRKTVFFLCSLCLSISLSAQQFIVVWPDEAEDIKAYNLELLQHAWFHVDDYDIPFYRPERKDWAYTFHTIFVQDTAHFKTNFPRRYQSYPPFILEIIGYWNLDHMQKDISHSCGKRWRSRRKFEDVLQYLLGPSFKIMEQPRNRQENMFSYESTPLQILWDDPKKIDFVKAYEYPHIDKGSKPLAEDTVFDYSLHKAKWVILGRETAKKKHVLLLLTKNIQVITEK